MFNNNNIDIMGGVYETRFIASWLRVGGKLQYGKDYDDFREWLESLELTVDEVEHILNLARVGKLELETSAREFISKNNMDN